MPGRTVQLGCRSNSTIGIAPNAATSFQLQDDVEGPEQLETMQPMSADGLVPAATGEQAIVAAFEAARDRQKVDWFEMSVAVLKNRILDMTNRQFREADYGVDSFRDFLNLYPELVEIDLTRRTPFARLRGMSSAERSPQRDSSQMRSAVRWTIRPDLWKAVVDFRSGSKYAWRAGRAEVVESATGVLEPMLPTLQPDELQSWRADFVQSLPDPVRVAFESELARWRDVSHSTGALPAHLGGRWTGYFKNLVLDRLEKWFADNSIPQPGDLVERPDSSRPSDGSSALEQLRRLVSRYVDLMTEEELLGLQIPVSVLRRVDRADG